MLQNFIKKFTDPVTQTINQRRDFANDIGYAIIFDVDYLHNDETRAKLFFGAVHQLLILKGFNFEGRIFYRLGSYETVENSLKEAILTVKTVHNLDPKAFIRSAHLIPLSQFTDLTQSLVHL